MAPIDIREVEDFSYLKPRQRVIGRAENECHLLGWNPDPFKVIPGDRPQPGRHALRRAGPLATVL